MQRSSCNKFAEFCPAAEPGKKAQDFLTKPQILLCFPNGIPWTEQDPEVCREGQGFSSQLQILLSLGIVFVPLAFYQV